MAVIDPIFTKLVLDRRLFVRFPVSNLMKIRQTVQLLFVTDGRTWSVHEAFVYFVKNAWNYIAFDNEYYSQCIHPAVGTHIRNTKRNFTYNELLWNCLRILNRVTAKRLPSRLQTNKQKNRTTFVLVTLQAYISYCSPRNVIFKVKL
jgi:hypothetical protein